VKYSLYDLEIDKSKEINRRERREFTQGTQRTELPGFIIGRNRDFFLTTGLHGVNNGVAWSFISAKLCANSVSSVVRKY
jgi:hypothetical protein